MTRQERRAVAETKRKEIMRLIWRAMQEALKGIHDPHKAFSASCHAGDALIAKLIAANPQQKSLILDAGYRIRGEIERDLLDAKGTGDA